MLDVMAALKDRKAKAEAKVARAAKALESAQKELIDVIAAERVMADITGESVEQRNGSPPVSDRDKEITKLLATNPHEACSPSELHSKYIDTTGDSINLDAFRTALWRLQKKVVQGAEKTWIIKVENGRYWRESSNETNDNFEQFLGDVDDVP